MEHEVITIERGDSISPGTIGLTIAEAKVILEGLQGHLVASQVQEHNVAQRLCLQCGKHGKISTVAVIVLSLSFFPPCQNED